MMNKKGRGDDGIIVFLIFIACLIAFAMYVAVESSNQSLLLKNNYCQFIGYDSYFISKLNPYYEIPYCTKGNQSIVFDYQDFEKYVEIIDKQEKEKEILSQME